MADKNGIVVVGIGASAGGLRPIERFFDHMAPNSGMAFVIVQHLSPDFKSLMDELLARHTDMRIHKVQDGLTIERNSIYLIPPEKNMAISDGTLLLTDKAKKPGLHLPIDNFFKSLADEVGQNSIAVVLSGTGSDGSRGIRAVREAGGLVIVQQPSSAGFDGMPRAAISTGVVDLICEAHEIPDRILRYKQDQNREAIHDSEFKTNELSSSSAPMLRLYRIFRHRNNIDFSLYKPGTISRRLERRMRMSPEQDLDTYLDIVESVDREAELLFRDLLVEVTTFFRDPEAFERLRESIIPDLIARNPEDGEFRVWCSGCATGEEAYSIAMVVHDCLTELGLEQVSFKLFATDVHRKSLETASNGFYPLHAMEDVPERYRTKYFLQNNGVCNVKREIRQAVIFANNDLTKDPPFTRLDLICCRNVLIYLEPKVQMRILSMFHFGLKTKGVLFLGPSETVGDLANEFEQVDRHWRIYSKRRDVRLPDSARIPLAPVLNSIVHETSTTADNGRPWRTNAWLNSAFEDLLARHVPPSLLVNEYYELVHCFGDARKQLTLPEGKPTNDVMRMLDKNLGISVSAAIHRAKSEQIPVVYKGVRTQLRDDSESLYQVTVEPYRQHETSLYLISLEEMEKVVPEQIVEEFRSSEHSSDRIEQLERELNYTRETLQATVEELESSNEELQATNEELIASNEELQSTNEELHSVNEELYTVNSEHKAKIEELTQLTSDMDNLLKSTQIGTMFLDSNFNIRMFTPAISAGFNVMPQDIGRPISHISYNLDSPQLLTDAAHVLASSESKEREVRGNDNRIYLQRIQPYQVEDRTEGIVLTLTDITALREAEKAKVAVELLSEVSQELPDFAYAVSHDLQAPLRHINQYTAILENAVSETGAEHPEIGRATHVLRDSADKLRAMIDGLLEYSRINTLGKPLSPTPLENPINAAATEVAPALEVNQGSLEIPDELPNILGDDAQLKLLFFHLFENAIKYRGEAPPEIRVSSVVDGDWVRVTVEDNGIGIRQEHQEDVFTIFKRLGLKDKVPGSGIGLAVCRRIALRHHGRIWIEQRDESGIRVCVSFRLAMSTQID